jgi:hypothetical protein
VADACQYRAASLIASDIVSRLEACASTSISMTTGAFGWGMLSESSGTSRNYPASSSGQNPLEFNSNCRQLRLTAQRPVPTLASVKDEAGFAALGMEAARGRHQSWSPLGSLGAEHDDAGPPAGLSAG